MTSPAIYTAPAIYDVVVRHARTAPKRHSFAHRTYQWLIDLDDLPRLAWPLRAFARFEARDHLGDPRGSLRANVDAFLGTQGIDLGGGRILMLANARVLGYVFNPLTVLWCHRADGTLACVIAEVHNTYGERHCYTLRPEKAVPGPDSAGRYEVAKEFYVSPFYQVEGVYRMRLPEPGDRLALAIALTPPDGRPFVATVRGSRRPATTPAVIRSVLRYPWATVAVALRIRWHGIRLYLRGLPVMPRPVHQPQEGVS